MPTLLLRTKYLNQKGPAILLSLLYIGFYCGIISSLVVPCNCLRLQDTIGNTEGHEYCGSSVSSVLNLEHFEFPHPVEIARDNELHPGTPATFKLHHFNYLEKLLSAEDLALGHLDNLHLLCTDSSLSDYQHFHPEVIYPGDLEFSFQLDELGSYRLWAQVKLNGTDTFSLLI